MERFDTWTAPETAITVEYQLEAMDEIRQYALYGFRLLSRGGMELGGVLFGTRNGEALRIQTWRPIDCEHAGGPALLFSDKDHADLLRLLENSRVNPDLSSLEILGWFVSHTRAGCGMTDSDVEIYNHYFPDPFQVTLVLQPLKEAMTRAAFFVREAEGAIKRDSSYKEFTLAPLPLDSTPTKSADRVQVLDAPRPKLPNLASLPDYKTTEFRPAERLPATEPDMFKTDMFKPNVSFLEGRQIWIWAFMGLLILVVGVVITWKPAVASRSIGLRAEDSNGQLLLKWDPNSPAVQKATRGTLDIRDGVSMVQLPLDAARLKEGSFRYTRQSGDQEVRMSVYPSDGAAVQESTHLVSPGPVAAAAPSDSMTDLRQDRDRLAAENAKLKEQVKTLEAQLKGTKKAPARKRRTVKR